MTHTEKLIAQSTRKLLKCYMFLATGQTCIRILLIPNHLFRKLATISLMIHAQLKIRTHQKLLQLRICKIRKLLYDS